jgi:hypothetical protein
MKGIRGAWARKAIKYRPGGAIVTAIHEGRDGSIFDRRHHPLDSTGATRFAV